MTYKMRTVKPDLAVIAVDETSYWVESVREVAGRIWRLYLVDFNEHTYLCEMRPSYFGWHIHGDSQHRIEDDELFMEVHRGIDEESKYFATQGIKKAVVYSLKDYELSFHDWQSEEGYQEMMEDLVEAFDTNPLYIDIDENGKLFCHEEKRRMSNAEV